ncbi:hypothetical protein ACOME3_009480 [Neoechinorhynchus agilis]
MSMVFVEQCVLPNDSSLTSWMPFNLATTSKLKTIEVLCGRRVTMRCAHNVSSSKQVTWVRYANNEKYPEVLFVGCNQLTTDERFEICCPKCRRAHQKWALTISATLPMDNGIYACRISNTNHRRIFHLNVQEAGCIDIWWKEYNRERMKYLEISCIVYKSPYQVNEEIRMLFNNSVISLVSSRTRTTTSVHRLMILKTVILQNVTESDSGRYECVYPGYQTGFVVKFNRIAPLQTRAIVGIVHCLVFFIV